MRTHHRIRARERLLARAMSLRVDQRSSMGPTCHHKLDRALRVLNSRYRQRGERAVKIGDLDAMLEFQRSVILEVVKRGQPYEDVVADPAFLARFITSNRPFLD